MTQTKLRLSMEQITALRSFADANGVRWKFKLRDAWMTGRYRDYPGTHCYVYLQQVRNIFGTAWLVTFSFDDTTTHARRSA
jgi:hypothetical protein